MQGDRVRCCVARAVLASEAQQMRCRGKETALGPTAYDNGTAAVRKLFGTARKVANLSYDVAVDALSAEGDKVAKAAFDEQLAVSAPIILTRPEPALRPHGVAR
jgi:hypothetical protein